MNNVASVLSASDVSYSTPDGRALGENINLQLRAGELLLITGPNGSGKTTLLNILLGKLEPNTGSVHLNLPASHIGYLPQLQDSEMHMPVNLRDIINISFTHKLSDDEISALGLLTREHLSLNWNRASGGEKRRTLLTRTFLQKPELLILDEPFNHLDSNSRKVIATVIHDFLTTKNKSVILCTHEGFESYAQKDFSDVPYKRIAL